MIETLLVGKRFDKETIRRLLELQTLDEAKQRLKACDSEFDDLESEIDELTREKDEFEAEAYALEEIIPLWESALETPEVRTQLELEAAIKNPDQQKFEFEKVV